MTWKAGLFEQNEVHEKAFRYAVNTVNTNIQEDDFFLTSLVINDVPEDEPFPTSRHTCLLLNQGIVAIFGPRNPTNIYTVQSICDAKEIPHIITRWNYFPLRDSTEINFYPHPPVLSKAYYDIIVALDWKSFTVFYEDDEGLLRLLSLIQMAKDDGLLVAVKQLDKDHSGNYR